MQDAGQSCGRRSMIVLQIKRGLTCWGRGLRWRGGRGLWGRRGGWGCLWGHRGGWGCLRGRGRGCSVCMSTGELCHASTSQAALPADSTQGNLVMTPLSLTKQSAISNTPFHETTPTASTMLSTGDAAACQYSDSSLG